MVRSYSFNHLESNKLVFLIENQKILKKFQKYNDPHFRVRHNIFGFERHIPSFSHFDITACFFEEALAHRAIRLGWSKELVVQQDFRDFETR